MRRHIAHNGGRSIIAAAIALVFSLGGQVAVATGPNEASGTFAPTGATFAVRMAGGNTFIDIDATGAFAGPLTGAYTQKISQVMHADGRANVHGVTTCTCTIEGRTGTLVLRFSGQGSGTPTDPLAGQFVATSGTGALERLRLNAKWAGTGPSGTYTIRWHFE